MEKLGRLNLQQKGLFEIEVNDNGETIVIDTEDIEFPLKLQKLYEDVEKYEKEYNLQLAVINKKKEVNKGLLTNKEIESVKLAKKLFTNTRSAIDGVLGINACQKIFGDRNYVGMLDDLLEALSPMLEKIGMHNKSAEDAIKEKYAETADDTI